MQLLLVQLGYAHGLQLGHISVKQTNNRSISIHRFIILIIFLLFLLLLIKNPFSGQNIISDFEPLPDAIHYVSPARNLSLGQGLKITFEGRSLIPGVPPLYSLLLAPIYLISSDARSYYFANVLLSLASAGLFYLIMSKLSVHPFLKILAFFGLCTNFVFYWYPLVPMAENLFIFLYLLSIWLLLARVSVRNIVAAGFVLIGFYGTKYVEIIPSGVFGFIYLSKIYHNTKIKKRLLRVSIFLISIMVPLLIFNFIEYANKGAHVWPIVYLSQLFKSDITSTVTGFSLPFIGSSYLSSSHIIFNFGQYFAGFMGGELTVAAQEVVIMSPIIGMIGLIGLFINPFIGKFKLISIYFLLSFVSVFIFCLFFYVVEGRYLLFAVPILILSFAIFVDRLWVYFKSIGRNYLVYLTAIILLIFVLISQVPPVYSQLTESGSPINADRNYLVISMINSYFKNKDTKNIAVISTVPPYIFDYYAKPNYKLLPLSLKQTFMSTPKITWEEDDYSDLIVLYKKYLDSGYTLYLAFFKAETPWSFDTVSRYIYYNDFTKISQNFNLEEVTDGCEGGCSLYKVSLK